jgi:long-chain acyl-CoA synthetase
LRQGFYARFLDSVHAYPDQVAVELQRSDHAAGLEAYTYTQLCDMAQAVGRWLSTSGLNRADRSGILAANSPHWAAVYFGVLACGGIAVPLDTALKPEGLARLLDDSGSSFLFVDARHLELAREAFPLMRTTSKPRLVVMDSPGQAELPSLQQIIASGSEGFTPVAGAEDDVAVLLYTSGTTSDPKGVMLTNANLHAEADAVFRFMKVGPTDAILGVLPLFHALAQMANLLLPYSCGMRVVYLEQLNTTELLRALAEREITLFCCVPQFFYLIHEKVMRQVGSSGWAAQVSFRALMALSRGARRLGLNLGKMFFAKAHRALGPKMRYLITGGSRFDRKIGEDLETLGFDIMQAYGLTECSGGAVVTAPGQRFRGAVGKPLPDVQLKLLDPTVKLSDDPSEPASGEVLISGPIVMKGYFNRPDASAEVLRDGWLHTGDLGYIDSHGDLHITGRKKDVIVLSSGKNIYPEEIESHYAQSLWIKEICVLGLQSRPGEPFSERLHGVVVPDLETLRSRKIVNMKEVIRFDIETLSAQLPATKRILSYEIWKSDLPRTTTRKLKRFEIQRAVQRAATLHQQEDQRELSEEDSAWLSEPSVDQALNVVRAASKKKKDIHPNDNLELDLGLDSMERVELVVALEQALNAKADESLISEVYTVRELVDAVRAGIGSTAGGLKAGWEQVFSRETDEPDVTDIALPRPFATAFWVFVGYIVNALAHLLFRLEVTGREKLPKNGPCIICPNHQSFLDGPVLMSQLDFSQYRQVFFVGTSEIFGAGLMRSLARSLRLVPVDPDVNLVPAMRAGSFGLKRRMMLVLYPEGERSIDGEPKQFKKGAAILAVHHQVPVYPVALEGFHDCWPRGHFFRSFHKLRIAIGDPILPPPASMAGPEAYAQFTADLKQKVMDLWQPLHAKNAEKSSAAKA